MRCAGLGKRDRRMRYGRVAILTCCHFTATRNLSGCILRILRLLRPHNNKNIANVPVKSWTLLGTASPLKGVSYGIVARRSGSGSDELAFANGEESEKEEYNE